MENGLKCSKSSRRSGWWKHLEWKEEIRQHSDQHLGSTSAACFGDLRDMIVFWCNLCCLPRRLKRYDGEWRMDSTVANHPGDQAGGNTLNGKKKYDNIRIKDFTEVDITEKVSLQPFDGTNLRSRQRIRKHRFGNGSWARVVTITSCLHQ